MEVVIFQNWTTNLLVLKYPPNYYRMIACFLFDDWQIMTKSLHQHISQGLKAKILIGYLLVLLRFIILFFFHTSTFFVSSIPSRLYIKTIYFYSFTTTFCSTLLRATTQVYNNKVILCSIFIKSI